VYSVIKLRKNGKWKNERHSNQHKNYKPVINIRITSEDKKKLLQAFGSYANMRDFILQLVDEENNQEDGHLENYEKSDI